MLAVLDMGEDKQRDFVRNILIDIYYSNWMLDQWDKGRFSLADLAFRLRDGAVEYQGWGPALVEVWKYWCDQNNTGITFEEFWIHKAAPIHWIVAALMAKAKDLKADNKYRLNQSPRGG